MIKHYLVVGEGLVREKLIPLTDRLTVGRDQDNDIQLPDPSVSKHHAVVRLLRGRPVIEDLESRNGTFINDEGVTKSLLRSGDTLRLGTSSLRYIQETPSATRQDNRQTQELTVQEMRRETEVRDGSSPSRRVLEVTSQVPPFRAFTEEELTRVCEAANLVVFEPGKTIVRQGDRGKALYLVLDGKVRMSTCDNGGKEVLSSFLRENQIFGEISFLTGNPCTATVRAEEETLICEIRSEVMRDIVRGSANVRRKLEKHYRTLMKELKKKMRAAGVTEQPRHPRFNVELRVDFSISHTSGIGAEFQDRVFQAQASDLSTSGIRVRAHDPSLLKLPAGQRLHLVIFLPDSLEMLPCLGVLRNLSQEKGNRDFVYLGVEFVEMAIDHKRTLERFLTGDETVLPGKLLVVDDDEGIRELLSTFLESKGYDVALASSGEEALAIAEKWNPQVILLDVRMPGLDGIEVCMRLKRNEKTRSISVIVATAFEETVVEALDAGADDFVSKPFHLAEIALRLGAMFRVGHLTDELKRTAAYLGELERAPRVR